MIVPISMAHYECYHKISFIAPPLAHELIYIYNHEKVAKVHSLPPESTIQRPRIQTRGQ